MQYESKDMRSHDLNDRLADIRMRLDKVSRSYRYELSVKGTGTVIGLGDGIVRIRGLPSVGVDELVRFPSGSIGIVMDLKPNEVNVILLGSDQTVNIGDAVVATDTVASVPVGPNLRGRVVDPLGKPLDGLGRIRESSQLPMERPSPLLYHRASITEPLLSGLTIIDAMFPIGKGQRQLILGDRGTGKTTIATDTIINQRHSSVVCVYTSIGQKGSAVRNVIDGLKQADCLDHSVLVVAAADSPPGMRYIAPYAATSIAEFFRDQGMDALVVFDDLSKHAVAYRELSLLLRRPPGREAYPGDIFFVHSRLLERATHLVPSLGGGSLTMLPIVETQAGRISDYIPTNVISITDGQWYLDPEMFDRGIKPAVHPGLSVSRVGGKTQLASMKSVAGPLRLDTARFNELEVFSRFGSRLDESTRKALVRGARVREVLKQPPSTPIALGEQVALLVALEHGQFDDVNESQVQGLTSEFLDRLRLGQPELLAELDSGIIPSETVHSRICAELAIAKETLTSDSQSVSQ